MSRPARVRTKYDRIHWRFRLQLLASLLLVAGAGTVVSIVVGTSVAANTVPFADEGDAPKVALLVVVIGALAGLVGSVVVALAVGKWLFTRVVTPVRAVTKTARNIARGDFKARVEQRCPPEYLDDEDFAELAATVDRLAISLEEAERRRILSFGEVAHELRTPVAVLKGYFEGLLDGHVKPAAKTWAMLYDEASRVHRLLDELQQLSRAESKQAPPDLQAIAPAAIVNDALDRLRLHFSEKGLQVVTDIPAGLPLVLAEQDQALQVLSNLLTNALRYTPAPGKVTVAVRYTHKAHEVVFSVTDTGVGIAAEHIPHLFERFFRVDRSGPRRHSGEGIGLPVAKALVDTMGGRIWAESEGLGKGCTFSFTLIVAPPYGT